MSGVTPIYLAAYWGSELFAEDEPEVDRLFAAVSSQFEYAYNNDYTSKAVECLF